VLVRYGHDPDRLIDAALVRRVMATTGLDGYAATAVVGDFLSYGADSPYADVCGPALAELFNELAKPVSDAIRAIVEAFQPGLTALGRSMFDMTEKMRPAILAVAQFAHDHDKAAHPRKHRRNCVACRHPDLLRRAL
jgi:hypothetical protein